MNKSMRRLSAAAFAMTAVTGLAVIASPAQSQAASHRSCKVEKHSTTTGVTKVGTATATVVPDGLKVTTAKGANADKVSWRANFTKPVLANTVTELNYETIKLDKAGEGVNDAALPAYQLFVKTPAGEGALVYEPYWDLSDKGLGNPQRGVRTEWNVLEGRLWTPSTTITGLPKSAGGDQSNLSFADVVAKNPKMTITGIGFGLGTYNAGTEAIIDEQRFATKSDCVDHLWSTGFKTGVWWFPFWPKN
jgi:hypothetical protein